MVGREQGPSIYGLCIYLYDANRAKASVHIQYYLGGRRFEKWESGVA